MKIKLALIALVAVFVVSCNSTKNTVSGIEGRTWKLKTLEGKEMSDLNLQKDVYFMLNSKENRVSGFAGCNSMMGGYTLQEGNRIHFTQMGSTMMACPDVTFSESDFLKVFELADNYTINNNELSLNVGRRAPLAVFEAVDVKK